MWTSLMGCSLSEYRDKMSDDFIPFVVEHNLVVGLGATILNGYSYIPPTCGLTIYTCVPEMDGMITIWEKWVYLENYNTTIGYENSHISSPERNICDYLMYPDKLGKSAYLTDALEGYEDEFGNFDKVYEMMDKLGIPRELLDEWIPYMWGGE